MWYYRNFVILSNKKAENLGLNWLENIHGDRINRLNCRSLWTDDKKRIYRVEHLVNNI